MTPQQPKKEYIITETGIGILKDISDGLNSGSIAERRLCELIDSCYSRPAPSPSTPIRSMREDEDGHISWQRMNEQALADHDAAIRNATLDEVVKWKRKNCFWIRVDPLTGQKRYHFDPAQFDEFIESLRSSTPAPQPPAPDVLHLTPDGAIKFDPTKPGIMQELILHGVEVQMPIRSKRGEQQARGRE